MEHNVVNCSAMMKQASAMLYETVEGCALLELHEQMNWMAKQIERLQIKIINLTPKPKVMMGSNPSADAPYGYLDGFKLDKDGFYDLGAGRQY